ncbi:hypothetical protein BH23GEM5_BH23GEM5_02900 [soil metagenome]|jgi:hypothetical protein
MAGKTLRTIQPAHKSDKVTVAQAEKVWRTVARKSTTGPASSTTSRSAGSSTTGHTISTAAGKEAGSGKDKRPKKASARKRR